MVCGVTNWRPSFCARQCGKGVKWRWFLTPETFPQGPPVALKKPRGGGLCDSWQNYFDTKLLRTFGKRSNLLLAILGFVVFVAFVYVLLAVLDQSIEKAASLRAMAVIALGAPKRVRRRRYCAPR